jgi:hypothetical protein
MMSDQTFLILFLSLAGTCAASLAWYLATKGQEWRRRKIVIVAALPIPGLIGLACLWVFGNALFATATRPETCGVDACGMAMMFSLMGLASALGVFAFASVVAWIVCKRFRP